MSCLAVYTRCHTNSLMTLTLTLYVKLCHWIMQGDPFLPHCVRVGGGCIDCAPAHTFRLVYSSYTRPNWLYCPYLAINIDHFRSRSIPDVWPMCYEGNVCCNKGKVKSCQVKNVIFCLFYVEYIPFWHKFIYLIENKISDIL